MNYCRHRVIQFVQLPWITSILVAQSWFEPNKYTPSVKSEFNACISSRITTVIHVTRDHQINDNWFNEPFAVSQYKQLILRHAWLNLWDKHMTTGRINQVARDKALSAHRARTGQKTISLTDDFTKRLFSQLCTSSNRSLQQRLGQH